jgi:hypothetical protein
MPHTSEHNSALQPRNLPEAGNTNIGSAKDPLTPKPSEAASKAQSSIKRPRDDPPEEVEGAEDQANIFLAGPHKKSEHPSFVQLSLANISC